MATTKKTTARKSAPKKTTARKTTSRATATRKTPVRKTATKRTRSKKSVQLQSFRLAPETTNFTEFRITRQTIYWIILIAFIVFAQLWILKLQIEVATLLEAQQAQLLNF